MTETPQAPRSRHEATRTWTILEVLNWTKAHFEKKGIDAPRLDAEVLLAHTLGLERVMLYARFDQPLKSKELAQIRAGVARRAEREPIAYIVGQREFWSMNFKVTSDVLVPRPETEQMIEIGLALLSDHPSPRALDVGTGSGCIALALAKELKTLHVVAVDISPAACEIARHNTEAYDLASRVDIRVSDLLDQLPSDSAPFDLITANLPYIPKAELDGLAPEIRRHEPQIALDGGEDGLVLIDRLIRTVGPHLRSGGHFLLEAGPEQLPKIADQLRTTPQFTSVEIKRDTVGTPRIVTAKRSE